MKISALLSYSITLSAPFCWLGQNYLLKMLPLVPGVKHCTNTILTLFLRSFKTRRTYTLLWMGLLLHTVLRQKMEARSQFYCIPNVFPVSLFLWFMYSTLQRRQFSLPGTAKAHKSCVSLNIYLIVETVDPMCSHIYMTNCFARREFEIRMVYMAIERQQCLQQSRAQD